MFLRKKMDLRSRREYGPSSVHFQTISLQRRLTLPAVGRTGRYLRLIMHTTGCSIKKETKLIRVYAYISSTNHAIEAGETGKRR